MRIAKPSGLRASGKLILYDFNWFNIEVLLVSSSTICFPVVMEIFLVIDFCVGILLFFSSEALISFTAKFIFSFCKSLCITTS